MFFKKRKVDPTFQNVSAWVKYIDSFKVSKNLKDKMKSLVHEYSVTRESILYKSSKSNNEAHNLGLSLVGLIPDNDENSSPKDAERLILETFDFVAESYKIAFANHKATLLKILEDNQNNK